MTARFAPLALVAPIGLVALMALVALTALPTAPAMAFDLPARDSFDASVQRPLFFPGRRAGPPQQAALPPDFAVAAPAPPQGVRLIGLAVDQRGRSVAVLRAEGAEGAERRVIAGDTVQGWTIDQVGRGVLVLTLGSRHTTVPISGVLPKAPE